MERLIYTKYSTDRNKKLAIRTDRLIDDKGVESIKKVALFDEGIAHLEHMVDMSVKLQERYGDRIKITKSNLDGKALSNEFVIGKSFYSHFEELVDTKDIKRIKEELNQYRDTICYSSKGLDDFSLTTEFIEVFGEEKELEDVSLKTSFVTDIDMIFENIIVSDSGQWQLIDYEWTFDFPIPQEYMLFRSVWYLYNNTPLDNLIPWHETMEWVGVDRTIENCFRRMEQHFQSYIMGDVVPLEQQVAECDTNATSLDSLIEKESIYYTESRWYIENMRKVQGENQILRRELEGLKGYKKLAEKSIADYNLLKDAYTTQQNEIRNIKLRKMLKKIRNYLGRAKNKVCRGN